jgi:hypothetical protein
VSTIQCESRTVAKRDKVWFVTKVWIICEGWCICKNLNGQVGDKLRWIWGSEIVYILLLREIILRYIVTLINKKKWQKSLLGIGCVNLIVSCASTSNYDIVRKIGLMPFSIVFHIVYHSISNCKKLQIIMTNILLSNLSHYFIGNGEDLNIIYKIKDKINS